MLSNISPLILTFNEEANIERVLTNLRWADEIIVIDSYSQDSTIQIISKFQNVKVYQRKFDNHTNQWNFGLGKVNKEWVLS